MNRFGVLALVVLVVGPGCKLLKKGKGGDVADDPGGDPGAAEPAGEKPKKTGGCALPEDGHIGKSFTVARGCNIVSKGPITVDGGATLKIEAGARIAFGPRAALIVNDGKLVVAGTEKEPVLLTSASKTPAPGDWAGLIFSGDVMAGTEIVSARIEYAGVEEHMAEAALTLRGQRSSKRVSVVGTTFQNNDRRAIFADTPKSGFSRFERNTFKSNKISLSAPAVVLGTIGTGNTFGDPLETGGVVGEATTWPAFGAPVIVHENLVVGAEGAGAASLAMAPGTVIKLVAGTYVGVGEHNGGALVAPKVTFTSANATPHPGDWACVRLHKRASNTNLEGATIEFAGEDNHLCSAALTLYDVTAKELRGVKLAGMQIKSAAHAGVATPDHDCGEIAKQITVTGGPLCRKE